MPATRPDAGRKLLPHAVDDLADHEPDRVLYEIPSDKQLAEPYRKVTARQYGIAIDRAAWWLRDTLGQPQDVGAPTVGYVGPGDLRYLILVIAAIKAGYKMLYVSPRNTVEGDIAVIEAAECRLWLVPTRGSTIHRALGLVEMSVFDLPDLPFFLDGSECPRYEYKKTWEQGHKDPCWVLHTSGSTGNPKPVIRYQDSVASIEANNLLPNVDGRPLLLHDYFGARIYVTFPFFHAAGLANSILWPLFWGSIVVLGPDRPVTLDLMKEVIRKTRVDAVFTAPSIVQDISYDGEFLKLLESVKAIAYGGGPVSKEAGDRIIKHTKLRLSIGTTESGWLSCVETDLEDWNYLHFHPYTGLELQDRGGGLFELVAVRKSEYQQWQPIFSTFRDLQHYSFKDLFSRHPLKPHLYTYEGRSDNVIVLSNGEKFQPHAMELLIASHPAVKSAVVAGQGRFQISLLVEPVDVFERNKKEKERFISAVWPIIKTANEQAPGHAKLARDRIVIAHPDKPFSRTSKGTVRRGPTLELYKDEFDEMYARADNNVADGDSLTADQLNYQSLYELVKTSFQEVARMEEVSDDADFFAVAGVDSLQILTLRRKLQRRLSPDVLGGSLLTSRLIYENPTVRSLSKALFDSFAAHTTNGNTSPSEPVTDDPVQQLITKYISDLPQRSQKYLPPVVETKRKVVVLTGSTGSLGSYILDNLMNREDVHEIFCLNRSGTAKERQSASNARRGLRTDFDARGVHFLHSDLGKLSLGLHDDDYRYLVGNATHIIHTQWRVDFNLAVTSFEPQIQGVRNMLELVLEASKAHKEVRLFFTSSVGVANGLQTSGPIPESKLEDGSGARTGYGKSKLVAEELLWQASYKSNVDVVICRIGQIAGPVKPEHNGGEWNRKEWLPSIIELSRMVSVLPQTLGANEEIDWIPVDILSTIIIELAFQRPMPSERAQFLHCVNPRKAEWETDLLPTVRSKLGQKEKALKIVPLTKWVESIRALSARPDSSVDGEKSSAFALIDFLSELAGSQAKRARFDTALSVTRSDTLKELPPVHAKWMEKWLDQWYD